MPSGQGGKSEKLHESGHGKALPVLLRKNTLLRLSSGQKNAYLKLLFHALHMQLMIGILKNDAHPAEKLL